MPAEAASTGTSRKRHNGCLVKKLRATSEIVQNKETEPRVARIAALTNTFDAPRDQTFKENEKSFSATVKRSIYEIQKESSMLYSQCWR